MNSTFSLLALTLCLTLGACNAQNDSTKLQTTNNKQQTNITMETNKTHQNAYNTLTTQETNVLVHKYTDRPFTGEYYAKKDHGVYICRQCNAPLYQSADKFDSHCGWPSFDDEIDGSVKRIPDADGSRIEIVCNNCQGHLGHVFEGEGFTAKDTRHCVNTSSIKFIPSAEAGNLPKVIVLSK